jgi:hypothetical protein
MKKKNNKSEKYYRVINSAEENEKNGNYQKATTYYNIGLKIAVKEDNKDKINLFNNLLFTLF